MLYKGECLNQISFPLGGIGTGSIGLAGNGSLVDFEIFNRPNKGAINPYTFFAIRAEYSDGTCVSKVLQGDHTRDLAGQYSHTMFGGYGYGPDGRELMASVTENNRPVGRFFVFHLRRGKGEKVG